MQRTPVGKVPSSPYPDPPLPADVDLRDVPPPRDLFVAMAISTYGVSRREAETMIDAVIRGACLEH
jgi:hypothetical protein